MATYRTVIALVGTTLIVGAMSTGAIAKGKAKVIRVTSPSEEAELGYSVYPSPGQCQFVDQKRTAEDGRVFHLRYQVCH